MSFLELFSIGTIDVNISLVLCDMPLFVFKNMKRPVEIAVVVNMMQVLDCY